MTDWKPIETAPSQEQVKVHRRVIMIFKRINEGIIRAGKGSCERVLIETIDAKNRPVFYGSELAAKRISRELTNSEHPYNLKFVVDVDVVTEGGALIAYCVNHVHDVLELDE